MAGPRILVTGAGRGIGRSIALRFAAAGSAAVLVARTEAELERAADDVRAAGGTAVTIPLDVTDGGALERALPSIHAFTGGALDVLVNNAGAFDPRPFEQLDEASWRHTLEVNLTAPWRWTRALLPALRAGARPLVCMVGSTAALQPFEGSAAYCASKYGLRGLADVLRLELELRVSCVHPRGTDTSIFDGVAGDWDRTSMDRPEDVAEVVFDAWRAPDAEPIDEILVGDVVDARRQAATD